MSHDNQRSQHNLLSCSAVTPLENKVEFGDDIQMSSIKLLTLDTNDLFTFEEHEVNS